jgi:predicted nucleic acid-binding protein
MGRVVLTLGSRFYFDTNIVIYALEDFTDQGGAIRQLFSRVDAGEIEAWTSELTLAEVLVKPI